MATVSSNCCMSMKPPPSPSSSSSSSLRRSTQVTWARKEGSWRRHLAVGMACMIITLQNGELNLTPMEKHSVVANAEFVVESKKGSLQWSNQRQCQPWRLNSLETIVPENLPRPSAHRRWEKVNHPKDSTAAPSVQMLTNIDNKCFTM